MRTYEGAVLFVDILGIGALTTSPRPMIELADIEALGRRSTAQASNQTFCATLLTTFRKNLRACRQAGLKVAQLSDSAFLWSEDHNVVVEAATKLFWLNTRSGIFARGGMSFGEIVEPDKVATSIGEFICGNAATRAVTLERAGKGARIFVDTYLPGKLFNNIGPGAFVRLTNPSDFEVIDEFLWFLVPAKPKLAARQTKRGQMNRMLEALGLFRYSAMYRWNTGSVEGQIQVGATIERISLQARALAQNAGTIAPEFALTTRELYLALCGCNQTERSAQRLASHEEHAKNFLDVQFPPRRKG